jgi:hypothetical protein
MAVSSDDAGVKGAAPAKKAPVKAVRPAVRASRGRPRSAGKSLLAQLTRKGDPVELSLLIRQAARIAERLEALDRLLSGSADAWAVVSLPRGDGERGRVVVEVQVADLVREERAQSVLFRGVLADIHRQRAGLPAGGGDGDEDDDLVE